RFAADIHGAPCPVGANKSERDGVAPSMGGGGGANLALHAANGVETAGGARSRVARAAPISRRDAGPLGVRTTHVASVRDDSHVPGLDGVPVLALQWNAHRRGVVRRDRSEPCWAESCRRIRSGTFFGRIVGARFGGPGGDRGLYASGSRMSNSNCAAGKSP